MLDKITLEMLSKLSAEDWMVIIGVFSFFMAGIGTFLFGRICVKHLERKMAKGGGDQPLWDKGIGAIGFTYALTMVFPKLKSRIVNVDMVKQYTRKKDKKIALLYVVSVFVFLIFLVLFSLFYVPDDILS